MARKPIDLASLGLVRPAHACGTLNAYINEVNAQMGKSITSAQAADLIEDAEEVQATIGC